MAFLEDLGKLFGFSSSPAGTSSPTAQSTSGDVPEAVKTIFGMPEDKFRQRIRAIGAGMANLGDTGGDPYVAAARGFGGATKYFQDQEEAARKQALLDKQQAQEDARWREKMDFDKTMGERRLALEEKRLAGDVSNYDKRREEAARVGLTEDDPAYRTFILTGNMPRGDQAPLTTTDKKAILEADEMVAANEAALNALDHAIGISGKANQGYGASIRAALGNNLPDGLVPDFVSSPESSAATADYDNAVIGQALQQLKATFGAAPTEGERKILLELQGSSNLPHEVRVKILERAKAMAERRLEFNRSRAEQLRGGSFYKTQPVHDDSVLHQPTLSGPGLSGNDTQGDDKEIDDLVRKYGG